MAPNVNPTPLGIAADVASSLTSSLLQWYGMNRQAEENRKTREANAAMFQTQLGFEKEQFGANLALGKRKQDYTEQQGAFGRKMATQQAASDEETKQFDRQLKFMTGFTSMINSSPQARTQLVNLWRQ